jgi:hypothetical protein
MNLTWKQYIAIGSDLLAIFIAFYFGHWVGFALAVVFLISVYAHQMLLIQQTTRDVLLSRLPQRCKMCHREIVAQGAAISEGLANQPYPRLRRSRAPRPPI